MALRPFIGSSINNNHYTSILHALDISTKIGGTALQIYVGDKVLTTLKTKKKISSLEIKDAGEYIKKHNIKLIIHAILSLNFCNPISKKYEWGLDNLIFDMKFSSKLGGIGCVIHLGTRITKNYNITVEECIKNYVESLEYVIKNSPKNQKIYIETSSNQKNKIGGKIEELAALYNKIGQKYKNRIKICVDTAHIFEAGYPINTNEGVINYFKEFNKYIGIKNIKIIHINDSETELGSKIDRHAPLGKGYIFDKNKGGSFEALREIYKIASKHNIILILETPFKNYKKEIKLLKSYNDKNGGGKKKDIKQRTIDIFKKLEKFHKFSKDPSSKFREYSYSKAIKILENYKKPVYNSKNVIDLPGIGLGFQNKINEISRTGSLKLYNNIKKNKSINKITKLENIIGIGPKKAEDFIKSGYNTPNKIKKAIKDGKLKISKLIECGLKYEKDLQIKIPRKEAELFKNIIYNGFLKQNNKNGNYIANKNNFILAGSFRRGKQYLKDIDIIIVYENKNKIDSVNIVDVLKKQKILIDVCSIGKDSILGLVKLQTDNVQFKPHLARHIDIRLVKKKELPFYLLYFSSGVHFSRYIRAKASKLGYRLDSYGIYNKNTGKKLNVKVKEEKDIFKLLDVDYIKPEDR